MERLSIATMNRIMEYMQRMETLSLEEPERLTGDDWDVAMKYIRETGKIPDAYRERISSNTFADSMKNGELTTGYYDTIWEEWNSRIVALNKEYHDDITEAMYFAIRNELLFVVDGDGSNLPANTADTVIDPFQQQSMISFLQFVLDNCKYSIEYFSDIKMPEEIAAPKDKVTYTVFSGKLIPTETMVGIAVNRKVKDITIEDSNGKKSKEPFASFAKMTLLDLPDGVCISRDITSFDNQVFSAICSLWDAGTKRFTGSTIYKTMIGNHDADASPEMLKRIDESWSRLTATAITLDTGTVGYRYNFARWKKQDRLISGSRAEVEHMNQHGYFKATIYEVDKEPMLLQYANSLNQVLRFPISEMNTPVNKTPDILSIQFAMRKHIDAIPDISNHILYDTLFEGIDFPEGMAGTNKRQRLRKSIKTILDYWQSVGVISSYKEITKGRKCVGVEVTKPKKHIEGGRKTDYIGQEN